MAANSYSLPVSHTVSAHYSLLQYDPLAFAIDIPFTQPLVPPSISYKMKQIIKEINFG